LYRTPPVSRTPSPRRSERPSTESRRKTEHQSQAAAFTQDSSYAGSGAKAVVSVNVVKPGPVFTQAPDTGELLAEEIGELHLFDVESGHFVLQDGGVTASVIDIGKWNCKSTVLVMISS